MEIARHITAPIIIVQKFLKPILIRSFSPQSSFKKTVNLDTRPSSTAFFNTRLFPDEFTLSRLHFHEHDTDPVSPVVFDIHVPVKDHKVDRVADEPCIGRGERELRQERGNLPGDPPFER